MYVAKIPRSKFYQIVYFVKGKRTTKSTKKSTLEEAEIELAKFQKSLAEPLAIIPEVSSSKNNLSLSSFQTEYLDYIQPIVSQKYYVSIKLSFAQFISFTGNKNIEDIDSLIIDKFITRTFKRTQRGAHLYFRTLKAIFFKAVLWKYISHNPFSKMKFPRITKSYPAFITESQLLIIISNTRYQHLKDIFYVAFYTGLRLGELINMKWSWVDFSQNHIVVTCSKEFQTKNKKDRTVPMAAKARSVLINRFQSNLHNPNEFVFYHTRGKRLYQEAISKQFKKIVRKSNLDEKIHFHSLHHSFASALVQRGVSLNVIKELLGHEDLSTTQIYSHLQKQNLMDAVNLL